MAWIGVVDCNNFFVSCERIFRPDLHNKPVAVLSSNDGCVVARSQEVKDLGVPVGVPYFKVKDIVKDNDITLFSSHFALYRDVSRRVFLVLRELLDEVEQYSVDEAFFVIDREEDTRKIANIIKTEIERKVGVPVSVGIASSKTQAKYAVDLAKKTTGIKIIDHDEWNENIHSIQLSELWGVGGKSFIHYKKAGYDTVKDLIKADSSRIKALFGVSGERLVSELKGKSIYKINAAQDDQKSMMSTRSFKQTTQDISVLEDAISYHARHIASDLRTRNLKASMVRIAIRASKYSDFSLQGSSLEAVLDIPTNDTFKLLEVAQKLLKQAFKADVPYKKVGVIVGGLQSTDLNQNTLFQSGEADNERLLQLVDGLNKKAHRELITLGDRKKREVWQARKDMMSPAYTTKWTDVVMVKA